MRITPIQEIVKNNIANNILEKGEVNEAFSYGNEITYDWTGEDIKESLQRILSKKKGSVEMGLTALNDMKISSGLEPDETNSKYSFGGFEEKILASYPILGKVYSWSCRSTGSDCISNLPNFETGSKIDTESKAKTVVCQQYNDLVDKVASECADACQIQLMLSNLEDGKIYKLTNSQLKVLEQ